jgi:cytochrome c553
MKKIVLAMTIAGTTLLMADGAALYAKCAGCHGADGKTKALGKSAPIAGRAAADVVKDLEGYKAGTLNKNGMGGVMKGQANMSPEDMKAVAEYISKLAK